MNLSERQLTCLHRRRQSWLLEPPSQDDPRNICWPSCILPGYSSSEEYERCAPEMEQNRGRHFKNAADVCLRVAVWRPKKMSLRFWLILCGNNTAILAKVRRIVEYAAKADFYDI